MTSVVENVKTLHEEIWENLVMAVYGSMEEYNRKSKHCVPKDFMEMDEFDIVCIGDLEFFEVPVPMGIINDDVSLNAFVEVESHDHKHDCPDNFLCLYAGDSLITKILLIDDIVLEVYYKPGSILVECDEIYGGSDESYSVDVYKED